MPSEKQELQNESKALAAEALMTRTQSQITCAEVDDLADRLTGRGMEGLRTDDWPILVLALEYLAASFTPSSATELV